NCVDQFVASVDASASVPWMMKYTALGISEGPSSDATGGGVSVANGMYAFPPPTLGVAASDGVLEQVKSVWQSLLGKEWGQDLKVARFLVFEDREPIDEDEEEQMDA
ncbi:Rab proteins geranylgeranyltransferase component A, partial [Ascosphaera atra]